MKRIRLWPFLWGVGILAVAFILIGPRILFHNQAKSGLSAEQLALFDDFRNRPLYLPEGEESISKTSKEFIEFAESKWEHLLYGSVVFSDLDYQIFSWEMKEPTIAEWDEVKVNLIRFRPAIEAATMVASYPGYRMDAFFPSNPLSPGHNVYTSSASRPLALLARAQANQGKWEKAFDSALFILRLSCRTRGTTIGDYGRASSIQRLFSTTLMNLAEECPNSNVLRESLANTNRLIPKTCLRSYEDAALTLALHLVADDMANGSIAFEPGKPGIHYLRHMLSPKNLDRESFWSNRVRRVLYPLYVFWGAPETMFGIIFPNYIEMMGTEKQAEAAVDLSRLHVAQRIQELEGTAPSGDSSRFVPDFFEENLTDPFTGEPYLWNEERKRFYSVGSDETDDLGALSYSPTNGSNSTGDVLLE